MQQIDPQAVCFSAVSPAVTSSPVSAVGGARSFTASAVPVELPSGSRRLGCEMSLVFHRLLPAAT